MENIEQQNTNENDPTRIKGDKKPGEVIGNIFSFVKNVMSLRNNSYNHDAIRTETIKSIEFKGYNVWILMLSIVIASVGLNVNSNAVIIGAMLISPLMGPIRGIGFGVGTNDFGLLIESLKYYGVTVGISLTTSFLYFLISPINDVTSELFARTEPNFLDVVIAFTGGLAGIIAAVSGKNDTVIPGVAIATALMPPLCTAGFGLAHGDLSFFLGAFYLFLLNSLLIALSSVVVLRYLKFPRKVYLNPKIDKRVQTYITIFVIVIVSPSFYLFYKMTKRSIFESNATQFVEQVVETHSENIMVFPTYNFDFNESEIQLEFPNAYIDSVTQKIWERQLPNYDLQYADLKIIQGEDFKAYTDKMLKEYDQGNKGNAKLIDLLQERENKINQLNQTISQMQMDAHMHAEKLNYAMLIKGYKIDYPELNLIFINRDFSLNKKGVIDTSYHITVKFKEDILEEQRNSIKYKISKKFLLELHESKTSKQDSVWVMEM